MNNMSSKYNLGKKSPLVDLIPEAMADVKPVVAELVKGNLDYMKKDNPAIMSNSGELPPQRPDVAILSCSDSRVIPEQIFNAKPGEFFVARVAGNIVNDDIIASFEYAIEPLEVQVILVMGHSCCGAVMAAADRKTCTDESTSSDMKHPGGYTPSACLDNLVNNIKKVTDTSVPGLETMIKENVVGQARKFLHSNCLQRIPRSYIVFGAYFDIQTEEVQFALIGYKCLQDNNRMVYTFDTPNFI